TIAGVRALSTIRRRSRIPPDGRTENSAMVRSPAALCVLAAGLVTLFLSLELRVQVLAIEDTHKSCRQALSFLTEGRRTAAAGRVQVAIVAYRRGIGVLGDSYGVDGLIDDTDQRLQAAKVARREGKLGQAATLLERTLAARLSLYDIKFRLANCR